MSARFSLKAATDDAHRALDARMARLDLANRADYGQFLHFQARLIPPLEAALDRAGLGQIVAGWSDARRTTALEADVAALGEPLPARAQVPVPASTADLLGVAYVVEGSRLGGRMLVRQVGAGFPAAFLTGDGSLGPWPALIAVLDQHLYSPRLLGEAGNSAQRCFALFLDVASEAGI